MNEYEQTNLFLNPYEVDGAERARRFAKNYNDQKAFGIVGVLEANEIIVEAKNGLDPEHIQLFRDLTDTGDDVFEIRCEWGEKIRRWQASLGKDAAAMAILNVTIQRDFEKVLLDSVDFARGIEQCEDYTGPAYHSRVN